MTTALYREHSTLYISATLISPGGAAGIFDPSDHLAVYERPLKNLLFDAGMNVWKW